MKMIAQLGGSDEEVSTGEIVLPGDRLGAAGPYRIGNGVIRMGDDMICSQMGLLIRSKTSVHVIPMKGEYLPGKNDFVIGIVKDHTPSRWFIDINTAHEARLHINDTPWSVDFGATGKYMTAGDVAYMKVQGVDDAGRADLTMKGPGLRKLGNGQVLYIRPSQVPRLIGKNGSLIAAVKGRTGCRVFLGKNGWIWADGDDEGIRTMELVLDEINGRPHLKDISDHILKILEGQGEA